MLVQGFGCAASCLFILPAGNVVFAEGDGVDPLHRITHPPAKKEVLVQACVVVVVLGDEITHAKNFGRVMRSHPLGMRHAWSIVGDPKVLEKIYGFPIVY